MKEALECLYCSSVVRVEIFGLEWIDSCRKDTLGSWVGNGLEQDLDIFSGRTCSFPVM